MPVRPGARAAAARLDPEQVVEQRRRRSCGAGSARRGGSTNDTIDSRSASGLPRISIEGLAAQRACARVMKSCSRSRIASTPDRRLELEHEARRGSTRRSRACRPPRGARCRRGRRARPGSRTRPCRRRASLGTRLRNSSRRATSTPGRPGPPMNLWGLMNTASLYASGSSGRVHLDRRRTARRRRSRRTRARRARGAAARSRTCCDTMPVTFDAAENDPIFSGRSGVPVELHAPAGRGRCSRRGPRGS